LFWYEDGQYLYDLIDENGNPDPALRPNQLLAMSLPFRLITGEKARSVLHRVESELYCEMGLRSLTASDTRYIPVYTGDPVHRDAAYHQGSVWSWLLGPYVDAVIHVRGVEGLDQARQIIRAFSPHLNEACIGSVSEIFDGDPPHRPRGCIAQAWGVAEILRVIKEYGIYHTGADQAIREKGIEEPKALT
jgi:glycogen debranching enzyme